ncbi:MAG: hypothetical protein GF401_10170 [Chitinivibrionales bacterium]|nr:hypothetical protein [Chitinivibrionales bacterium]
MLSRKPLLLILLLLSPLILEFCIRPGGADGSFYCMFGGGVAGIYEKITGTMTFDYKSEKIPTESKETSAVPAISAALGWFAGYQNSFGEIEIRYVQMRLKDSGQKEVPNNNAAVSHSTTLNFGFIIT